MKYDFSTYILNSLNENNKEQKKKNNITIDPDNKKVVISSNTTDKELVNFFKKHIDDIDIKEEGDKKVYVYNGEKG
jgi:predicted metal-dependent hydrolase